MVADRSLRSGFWVFPALLLAIAAFLNALAIGQLVGIGMEADADALARAPLGAARSAQSSPPAHQASADAILARNPFDHVTGPLTPRPALAATGGPARDLDVSDPWNAPACDGVDANAIAASEDPDWSFAAVSGADKKSHLLRRGAELGTKKVYFIGWDRLWLSSDEGLCQAKVFDGKKPAAALVAPPPPASASARPPSRGAKPLDPDLKKGIQAVSATEFNIDRSVVDRILENQSELMRQARIIPVQENGRTVGVRLLGVRPDTLLGVLGMKDGDRLQTINGFEVANPEKALEAYARLRTADKLTIQINRGGANMNLDYNIR